MFADQIIGTWSEMENNTTDCHNIIVKKENSEKVFISEFIYNGATGTHEEYNYYGFITKFNNDYFLNAKSSDGFTSINLFFPPIRLKYSLSQNILLRNSFQLMNSRISLKRTCASVSFTGIFLLCIKIDLLQISYC